MTVAVRTIDETDVFADLTEDLIAADPVRYTVLATNLDRIQVTSKPEEAYWFVFENAGRLVAAAMWTPPFPVHLPFPDSGWATVLAGHLVEEGLRPPGVGGMREAVETFTTRWEEAVGDAARRVMGQRLFAIDEVTIPRAVAGRMRASTSTDLDLIMAWGEAFSKEALPSESTTENDFGARLETGTLWLWDVDETPASMAFASRAIGGVSRISYVYTPPEHRRNGYAGALVAEASQRILSAGDHPVLFTDLANPTSNHIYQEVGYQPVADHLTMVFAAPQ